MVSLGKWIIVSVCETLQPGAMSLKISSREVLAVNVRWLFV
jgi:hypothetical protein